jgi:hypothetical protein
MLLNLRISKNLSDGWNNLALSELFSSTIKATEIAAVIKLSLSLTVKSEKTTHAQLFLLIKTNFIKNTQPQ